MQYRKILLKEKANILKSSTKDSLLDELLALRKIEEEKEIYKFLNPSRDDLISPYAFCDMQKAVSRINEAIESSNQFLFGVILIAMVLHQALFCIKH